MNSATSLLRTPSRNLHRACAVGIALASLGLATAAPAATLLYGYSFNETGTTADSYNGSTAMGLFNGSSSPTDLHGAAGSGVSGQTGDRALNLSSASGMSVANSPYGQITGATALSGLSAFTITGWYKADSSPNNTAARLMTTNNANINLFFQNNGLQLQVDGTVAGSATATDQNSALLAVGSWVFFAVSYDGSNAVFYRGTEAALTNTGFSQTLAQGALGTGGSAATSIFVGNRSTPLDRNFDGLMDDFRFYGEKLELADISAIRLEGVSNVPEPTGATLGFAVAGLALLIRRRRKGTTGN